MQIDFPVFIVGAGPTGLTMATVLQRYGIPFCIIDKKAEHTRTSNALGLHARTLELLEDLNLIDDFLQAGKKVTGANIYSHQRAFAQINVDTINSIYPYILIAPQSETEKILEEQLAKNAIHVERNTELTHLEKTPHGYRITVQKNGETKYFTAKYIIAADGSHSTVRKSCDMDFTGNEIPQQFLLADATLQTDLAMNRLEIFYADDGILALFPLPNGERRLICDVPHSQKMSHDTNEITRAITAFSEKRSNQQLRVGNCSWVSTFWIHSKFMKNMQHDNIFFMGDAAHIHSPAGGQGMNTGMQDAYNLGWKLALTLQGHAPHTILNSFNQERHPVIRGVVNQTDKMTRLLLARNPITTFFRNFILRPLLNIAKINEKLATHIAMLDIHYPKSSIIHYKSTISNQSPQPGDLVPEIGSFQPKHFTHYLKNKKYSLLIFCGKNAKEMELSQMNTIIELIKHDYKAVIDVHLISKIPLKMAVTQINDAEFQLHRLFNVEHSALVLIRPDKYLAYCSASLNERQLKNYLKKIFISSNSGR